MVVLSVLGRVSATVDGASVAIPGGRTTEVLVRLALDAGTVVRADRLIDELWGDDAASVTRNTLQSKVVKLRRALGDPGLVVSVDGGYVLAVDPASVDAFVVADHLAAARALLDAGDAPAAADRAALALAAFDGELWQVPVTGRG